MKRSEVFQQVGGLKPGRSVFDLSHYNLLTCDMGQLIPIMTEEMVPGDRFDVGNQILLRTQPLVAPLMHPITITVHYFFVPNRLMWPDWEEWITGGKDGDTAIVKPGLIDVTDEWTGGGVESTQAGGVLDYMGYPTGKSWIANNPDAFPLVAYWLIMQEYYRDENIDPELIRWDPGLQKWIMNEGVVNTYPPDTPFRRRWAKGYFESALPWQQRGDPVALPIYGDAFADFTDAVDTYHSTLAHYAVEVEGKVVPNKDKLISHQGTVDNKAGLIEAINQNTVSLDNVSSADISDLRWSIQLQKWLERSARGGARYTESIKAHFGVSNGDARLQRPEYIGGTKQNVIISEVLQTSEDGATPQGNLAGHGISVGGDMAGSYTATEHGWIIGIISVMPEAMYMQGLPRQYERKTRYDYYWPEFAHLSEQAIRSKEIYFDDAELALNPDNEKEFGFQGRYDEYRFRHNRVSGLMKSTLSYWHLGRKFNARPALNSTFLECNPTKAIYAVQNEPGLIVQVLNKIRAIRPMPEIAEPGLMDHF